MGQKYQAYRSLNYTLPKKSWAWNLYGAGLENLGRAGQPEPFSIPEPNDDQLLVRIDTISVCFSDGKNLQKNYRPGQRLAVQPDIYQQGKSTAYGYTVPGGMIQFHLIGDEVLKTDAGACLLPLEEH